MKVSIIKIYYVAALLLLGTQAVQTVYQLSQTIGYGQKLSHLQQQKTSLERNQMNVTKQISQISSLTALGEEDTNEFMPMTRPLLVTTNTSVASR